MNRMQMFVGLYLVASGSVAQAQPARMEFLRVLADMPAMTEVDVTPPTAGAVGRHSPFPIFVLGGRGPDVPTLLAGGRYIAWINWGRSGADLRSFTVFDRRTRTATGPLGSTSARYVVADPVRPRVFVYGTIDPSLPSGQITMYDTTSGVVRSVYPEATGDGVAGFAYASAADQLIVPISRGFAGIETAHVVDVASGAVIRDIPWPRMAGVTSLHAFEVSADGRRLYVKFSGRSECTSAGCTNTPTPLLLIDATTGAELARSAPFDVGAPLVAWPGRMMVLDERAGKVLVATQAGRLRVFDAGTLSTDADTVVPADESGHFWLFKGLGSVGAYTVSTPALGGSQINIWDRSYATELAPSVSCPGGMPVLAHVPASPGSASAHVTGRRVRVAWDTPGDTTEFQLLVGTSPGAPVWTFPLGAALSATFDDVPPGVYYASVRGLNENGPGPASAELRITVP